MRFAIMISVIIFLVACNAMVGNSSDRKIPENLQVAKINVQLGMAYLERNHLQRAKQKLLMALNQAPQLPEAWYSMAYFLEASGNKEEAKNYYQKAIALAPGRGDAENNYGTFLCRNKNYELAIKHFELATKDLRYLDSAGAFENAGLCALKIPDQNRALAYFQLALKQDHDRPSTLLKVANLYDQQGAYPLAQNYLHHFLQVASPNKQSNLLSKHLAKMMAKNSSSHHDLNMKQAFLQPPAIKNKVPLAFQSHRNELTGP